jgi:GTP pyrophosphokinase
MTDTNNDAPADQRGFAFSGAGRDPCFSPAFDRALHVALELHSTQRRKGSNTPYIGHLLGVCSIVLEAGGDEGQAIAALLHDAVEDCGGAPVLERIEREFGPRVASIVEACTDAYTKPKPPWRERKEKYITHLAEAHPDALLVTLADKIFNSRAILFDYRQHGEALFGRFHPDSDQMWYYRAIVSALRGKNHHSALLDELDRVVTELESLVTKTRAESER